MLEKWRKSADLARKCLEICAMFFRDGGEEMVRDASCFMILIP
jgi:hypothetical protein